MNWLQRYRVRHYLRNSFWIIPLFGMVVALMAVRALHWVEASAAHESGFDPDTARAVLGTMASSMFTFIVFVSSALLVAVQLASGQLSPRIIGIVFKEPVTRFSMTLFVFTFTFSLSALVRITSAVPMLTAEIAAYTFLLSLGVFLYLIDHVGKTLRPSGVLQAVAWHGRQVIDDVYPRLLHQSKPVLPIVDGELGGQPVITIDSPGSGVVLAFDRSGLAALAERADCVIVMTPQVGDSVALGDPLFRIFRDRAPEGGENTAFQDSRQLLETVLRHSVAIGQERTLEQDPTFAFRIMVDIASKALSPAINDPTTAVAALDQIHSLLRYVSRRHLDDGLVRDAAGRLRLVYRTPDWEAFVALAVTEIRQFGGASIQIARRLRAMLEHLLQTLPDAHAAPLRRELAMLHRSAERFFLEPQDRLLAEISDFQGVGGKQRADSTDGRTQEVARS